MPPAFETSRDIEGLIASLPAFASAAPGERAQLAARWREYLKEGHAGLQRQAEIFEGLYNDAVRALDLQAVKDLAAAALDQRREEATHIQPAIKFLVENLSLHSDDEDLNFILKEALEIARQTLANFDILHDRLIALVSDRTIPKKILRARPVQGKIDHGELSREFMARFPKIRAALAK